MIYEYDDYQIYNKSLCNDDYLDDYNDGDDDFDTDEFNYFGDCDYDDEEDYMKSILESFLLKNNRQINE